MDDFGVLPGWVAEGSEDVEDDAANIHFVLSTKRLLFNAVEQSTTKLPQFACLD
jgi:hypothetical protein